MDLFVFVFNPFAFFPAITAIANSFLLFLLIKKAHQTLITRIISIFVLIVIISGVGETLVRLSTTPSAADFWQLLNMPLVATFGPLILTIVLIYTGRTKIVESFYYQIFLFGAASFFIFMGWATQYFQNKDLSNFKHYYYGWNDTGDSGLFGLAIAIMMILLLVAVVILFRYRKKIESPISKKRTDLFIIAFLIPIAAGVIFDGIIQAIFGPIFPLMTISSSSLTAIVLSIAILKYKLFIVNPSTVASNIIQTMNEFLVVTNQYNEIEFINNAAESIFQYKNGELVNKNLQILFGDGWGKFDSEVLSQLKNGFLVSGVELMMLTSKGEKIPVAFSASPIFDDDKSFAGVVGIATDLRIIKSLSSNVEYTRSKAQAIRTIIDSLIDAILVLDGNNKIVMVNHKFQSLFNIRMDVILQKDLNEVLKSRENNVEISLGAFSTLNGLVVKKQNIEVISLVQPQNIVSYSQVDILGLPIEKGEEFSLSTMLVFSVKKVA